VTVDDESEAIAPVADPGRPPRNPRQVRARRRRRRRQLGTLLFLAVAAAVFAAAYFAVAGDDGSDDGASASTSLPAATTAPPPFAASYKVTTGVNVRGAPATSAAVVATLEQGHDVTVSCAAEGESVTGGTATSTRWLKVAGPWPAGFVSAVYVDTGEDLSSGKIPACPAA